MFDFDAVEEGFAAGLGMIWSAFAEHPWLVVLFGGIVIGALWLQLTPARRRRRR